MCDVIFNNGFIGFLIRMLLPATSMEAALVILATA